MKQENLYSEDCIRTYSGIYMNVFEPTIDMICIDDIAHGLSNQCRFAGHLKEFYSVAQHSVYCCWAASNELKLQALLHDASEAYLLDIPRPIKRKLPEYKKIEDQLMSLIAEKFGFDYPLHKEVKEIDELALKMEWNNIMLNNPYDYGVACWSNSLAKAVFLEEFKKLHPSKLGV